MDNLKQCPKVCETCEYHDDFTYLCCNGDSEHLAEYTSPDDSCEHWKRSE